MLSFLYSKQMQTENAFCSFAKCILTFKEQSTKVTKRTKKYKKVPYRTKIMQGPKYCCKYAFFFQKFSPSCELVCSLTSCRCFVESLISASSYSLESPERPTTLGPENRQGVQAIFVHDFSTTESCIMGTITVPKIKKMYQKVPKRTKRPLAEQKCNKNWGVYGLL